ncbi:hypothetical protein SDC9_165895 [bioreactor metagenome]|uniref:Uncharacterized protein n=1 Tax=bioreactor metagenome TaxID=1076179 RepID=A0A645FVQ3_9ZZZZ
MLVLAHANALGIDLDQLGQRILQAAGNRCRTTQAHVDIRHFLRRKLAGRIDRSPGLAHHHLVNLLVGLGGDLDQIRRQLVGFAAGCAVADGNQIDIVLFHQTGEHGQ